MATITATATGGLASAGSSWVGGNPPVDGDIIVIPNTATIRQDVDRIYGSKTAGVGKAITINAGTASVHGSFIVDSGVNLTLRGFDRSSNTLGQINAYGLFDHSLNSTVYLDVPTDGGSFLTNNGIIRSVGTPGGIRPKWTAPTANVTWNNNGSYTSGNTSTGYYDADNFIVCSALNAVGISNSANTGLGSFGDSSLSFSLKTPASILATEVSALSLVNGAGKYFVDYTNGLVYWHQATGATFNFTATYKKLSFKGATIRSFANAAGNQMIVQYADFSYLGAGYVGTGGNDYLLYGKNKQTGSSVRDFKINNSTFNFCKAVIGLNAVTGTLSNPISITDNSFNGIDADVYGSVLGIFRASNSFVDFSRNTGTVSGIGNNPVIIAFGTAGNQQSQSNWTIKDNVFRAAQFLEGGLPDQVVWPDSQIIGGVYLGNGSANDSRQITNFGGTPGRQAIVDGMLSWRALRLFNLASYQTIQNTVLGHNYHHTINGPTSQNDLVLSGVVVQGNISMNAYNGGAFCEFGYNRRQWFDNPIEIHNTIYKSTAGSTAGALSLGDNYDGGGSQMISKLVMASNLVHSCLYGMIRRGDNTIYNTRPHLQTVDYNAIHATTNSYGSGFNRFSTWFGLNNVTGCSLFNPTYTGPISGKTLSFTYNTASDSTLTWDGGVPVQLVMWNGTATSATNGALVGPTPQNGTLTDSSKAFPTAFNNVNTPIGAWIKITGGTGSGQVRRVTNCTATVLTVVPQWTTVPDGTSSYTVYRAEVRPTALDGINRVSVGIDLRSLPISSQSDANVGMVINSISADPQLVDKNRDLRTWDVSLGGPGTEDSAFARIFASPALARTALIPYIRAGFAPQNAAYATSGHDGTYIGAVDVFGVITPPPPSANTNSFFFGA